MSNVKPGHVLTDYGFIPSDDPDLDAAYRDEPESPALIAFEARVSELVTPLYLEERAAELVTPKFAPFAAAFKAGIERRARGLGLR